MKLHYANMFPPMKFILKTGDDLRRDLAVIVQFAFSLTLARWK